MIILGNAAIVNKFSHKCDAPLKCHRMLKTNIEKRMLDSPEKAGLGEN